LGGCPGCCVGEAGGLGRRYLLGRVDVLGPGRDHNRETAVRARADGHDLVERLAGELAGDELEFGDLF
jgi:hypothetical protein